MSGSFVLFVGTVWFIFSCYANSHASRIFVWFLTAHSTRTHKTVQWYMIFFSPSQCACHSVLFLGHSCWWADSSQGSDCVIDCPKTLSDIHVPPQDESGWLCWSRVALSHWFKSVYMIRTSELWIALELAVKLALPVKAANRINCFEASLILSMKKTDVTVLALYLYEH